MRAAAAGKAEARGTPAARLGAWHTARTAHSDPKAHVAPKTSPRLRRGPIGLRRGAIRAQRRPERLAARALAAFWALVGGLATPDGRQLAGGDSPLSS